MRNFSIQVPIGQTQTKINSLREWEIFGAHKDKLSCKTCAKDLKEAHRGSGAALCERSVLTTNQVSQP